MRDIHIDIYFFFFFHTLCHCEPFTKQSRVFKILCFFDLFSAVMFFQHTKVLQLDCILLADICSAMFVDGTPFTQVLVFVVLKTKVKFCYQQFELIFGLGMVNFCISVQELKEITAIFMLCMNYRCNKKPSDLETD